MTNGSSRRSISWRRTSTLDDLDDRRDATGVDAVPGRLEDVVGRWRLRAGHHARHSRCEVDFAEPALRDDAGECGGVEPAARHDRDPASRTVYQVCQRGGTLQGRWPAP